MNHQHLGRDVLLVDDGSQQLHRLVHLGRVERSDSPTGDAAGLHSELGVKGKMDVGSLKILHQVG